MKPEQYFLKYSYPCAHVLLESGAISEEKFKELEQYVLNNGLMEREELETIFSAAFRRMREVAAKMNKDVWDYEVIRKYFLEDHNMYIDKKDGNYEKFGDTFRNFCKVRKGKVISKDDDVLTVSYDGGERKVLGSMLPEAKVGDNVTIHQGFAVEILE